MIGLMELKGIVGQAAVTITAVENKEKTVQIDLCDIVNCGGNKIAWRGYDVYGCVWASTVRTPSGLGRDLQTERHCFHMICQ